MKKLLFGMAALAPASTGAWAQTSSKDTAAPADSTAKTDTMKSDSAKSGEVTGQLTKLDKSAKSVTISTSAGDEQTLKLASDAKIREAAPPASTRSRKATASARASTPAATRRRAST